MFYLYFAHLPQLNADGGSCGSGSCSYGVRAAVAVDICNPRHMPATSKLYGSSVNTAAVYWDNIAFLLPLASVTRLTIYIYIYMVTFNFIDTFASIISASFIPHDF